MYSHVKIKPDHILLLHVALLQLNHAPFIYEHVFSRHCFPALCNVSQMNVFLKFLINIIENRYYQKPQNLELLQKLFCLKYD